jgi:hypothetical protein
MYEYILVYIVLSLIMITKIIFLLPIVHDAVFALQKFQIILRIKMNFYEIIEERTLRGHVSN